MTTEHWDDPSRRQPMADPMQGRVDEHARRIEAARFARGIDTQLAGTNTASVRHFPVDAVPVISRDVAGRLVINWEREDGADT